MDTHKGEYQQLPLCRIIVILTLLGYGEAMLFLPPFYWLYGLLFSAYISFAISRVLSLFRRVEHCHSRKIMATMFVALFVVFDILYVIIPMFIMPYVDGVERARLGRLVREIVGNATSDYERAYRLYMWEAGYMVNIYGKKSLDNYVYFLDGPPYACIRLVGTEYPLWPLFSRCGACMEYSLLYRELAAAAGLAVRSVHDPGEDHNWDEVFLGGRWVVVDPSLRIFNMSPRDYGRRRESYVDISYVYAVYPNGTAVDVTPSYTGTGVIAVRVMLDGTAVEGARIRVFSLNYFSRGIEIERLACLTNSSGVCTFRLGDGRYRVEASYTGGGREYGGRAVVRLAEGATRSVSIALCPDP